MSCVRWSAASRLSLCDRLQESSWMAGSRGRETTRAAAARVLPAARAPIARRSNLLRLSLPDPYALRHQFHRSRRLRARPCRSCGRERDLWVRAVRESVEVWGWCNSCRDIIKEQLNETPTGAEGLFVSLKTRVVWWQKTGTQNDPRSVEDNYF